jgi:Na+/melibiose symporter-like transporter
MPADQLSRGRLLVYGAPGLPLAALGLPLYVFLPTFYSQQLGLSLAAVGLALLIARGLDVVTDPLVGAISDRLQRPWPRRKATMASGVPVLMLSIYLLFIPPQEAGFAYLLVWSILAYLGWTLVTLPYTAWGAELSGDYHERSRITASREGFVIVGTLAAAATPWLMGTEDDLGATMGYLALTLLLLIPLCVASALTLIPEPVRHAHTVRWREGLALLRSNRPFLRLLLAYLLNGIANGLPATLFLLFVGHVLEASDASGWLLLLYFAAGIAGLPLWLQLSRRIGKHRAWSASMLWAALVFIWVPLLGPGDLTGFALICVLSGLSLGVDMALPASMQADVVDVDRARGGGERAGLFFGLWGMTTKLALALAVGLAFPILDAVGFDAEGTNPQGALTTLALLYALLPVLFKLVAVGLVWSFPLDEQAQRGLKGTPNSHETGDGDDLASAEPADTGTVGGRL